ncbi:hypothetical protein HRI_005061500 [Hibiscus trionum]|uniref:Endonuclease/exonuclease/phosphatase domain-containing protein n=1 Tax=Hibiscus trionum TaxID=183268 RepID=A0A9W7JFZ0_HIBTR|nr:hypothetical protein HRI_005061500 [Hibiscus trionum]
MNFSIVTWNIRGLGLKEKRRAVKNLVSDKKPFLIHIQETKLSSLSKSTVRSLGCSNLEMMEVPAIGSTGGLISAWDPLVFEAKGKMSSNRFFNYLLEVEGFNVAIRECINSLKIKNNNYGVLSILKGSKAAIKEWEANSKPNPQGWSWNIILRRNLFDWELCQ